MAKHFVLSAALSAAVVASAAAQQPSVKQTHQPPVVISASQSTFLVADEVTFTARIRPDLAAEIRRYKDDQDYPLGPRIIGWNWIPDLDSTDRITKACAAPTLTCTMMVGWSGTIVFSIQVHNQLCAAWLHVAATVLPVIDERDSTPRVRFDSIHKAMNTKSPTWRRCTV